MRARRRATALAGGLLLAWLSSACGGDIVPARSPAAALPAYTASDAQLFDDGVEARAIGFEFADASSNDAKLLPNRVDASDGVVRARIVTITSKAEDSGTGYLLSMQALETLAGRRAPTASFVLYASPKSPAVELLRASEGRLVGLSFIVFVRAFADEGGGGGSALHFHVAPDDKDDQDRVRAASLGPLR